MCGATRTCWADLGVDYGLSPRVRGNRGWLAVTGVAVGPIPACAGQPSSGMADERLARAYPRVCGATMNPTSIGSDGSGLSPRVRGNREKEPDGTIFIGPIPACAGQPVAWLGLGQCPRAYPRVCGATANSLLSEIARAGLSPRVRGNLLYLTH